MINLIYRPKMKNDTIDLLSACMGTNEKKEILSEFRRYQDKDSRKLLGKIIDNNLVGLIGIEFIFVKEVELLHIAVKSKYRRQGIGESMIKDFIKKKKIEKMEAETDKEAVNFYIKIDFDVKSLGEKYPGVERFKCIWKG